MCHQIDNNFRSNLGLPLMRINILSFHTKQLKIMDHTPQNEKHFTVNVMENRFDLIYLKKSR